MFKPFIGAYYHKGKEDSRSWGKFLLQQDRMPFL